MADGQVTQTDDQQQVDAPVDNFNPFDDNVWVDTPVVPDATTPDTTGGAAAEPAKVEDTKTEDAKPDPNEILKTRLGFDDWEKAEAEIKSLREKAQTKEEIKFANEASQKLFDALREGKDDIVYEYLDSKRKLSSIENLDSASVLKLHIQQTNKHYTPEDVNDVFEEKYILPEKPQQEDTEDDDDYQARLGKWQSSFDKVKRRIDRDAKVAKDELAKLSSELVLPDIAKQQSVDPAVAEEEAKRIAKLEAAREKYVVALKGEKPLSGYEVKVQDEGVEIPIAYVVTQEEDSALTKELEDFDINAFVDKRWFDENGNPKVDAIKKDVYAFRNFEKIIQKVANETYAKAKLELIKSKSNIHVNGQGQGSGLVPDDAKSDMQKQIEHIWEHS